MFHVCISYSSLPTNSQFQTFLPASSRCNWQIKQYTFKLCSMMIWYMYVLWNNYHNQVIWHVRYLIVNVCVVRTLTISKFQMHKTVLLTMVTMLCLASPGLVDFITGTLCFLTPFTHCACRYTHTHAHTHRHTRTHTLSLSLLVTLSVLCIYELSFVCF